MCIDHQRAKKGETLALDDEPSQRGANQGCFRRALAPRYPIPGGSGGDGRNDKIGMAEVTPFARREATPRRCTDFTDQNSADATRQPG
jgi:hypothetical protein